MIRLRERGHSMAMDTTDAIGILASCFTVASLSGLAVLLRSRKPLTVRNIVSAILYNGLAGLIIALLWFNYATTTQNSYFIIGVSGLAGMGTINLMEFAGQLTVAGARLVLKDKENKDQGNP